MSTPLAIVLLQPGAADWEAGPVLPLLREHLGFAVRTATPAGHPVETIGGLRLQSDTLFDTADLAGADVVLLIGSSAWTTFESPALFDRLRARVSNGGPTGAICAGTLALARAGVLDNRPHTSNSLDFLKSNAAGYRGGAAYRDVPHAVAGGPVVTASGLAPVSFACGIARLAAPGKQDLIDQYWSMARAEFDALPGGPSAL